MQEYGKFIVQPTGREFGHLMFIRIGEDNIIGRTMTTDGRMKFLIYGSNVSAKPSTDVGQDVLVRLITKKKSWKITNEIRNILEGIEVAFFFSLQ
jgi:hypothetical protein